MNYAIVDIEATGGKQGEEDIIEVAIYLYDGEKVTDQMISLVSPDREIDKYVQRLTHITPKMVQTAPKFYELAKRVVEITNNATLVGHNIEFDYRMLRQEFKKLGYNYQRETIDTVRLSQEFFPEASSHSLGKLSRELGIPVSDRHRAAGDARATLELFKLLIEKDTDKQILKSEISKTESVKKAASSFMDLPAQPGIVYFFDLDKKPLFLSRAKNIAQKTRKLMHAKTLLSSRIRSQYDSIRYELTGGSLLSRIKEINEINELRPKFNGSFSSKEEKYSIGVEEENGYKVLRLRKGKRKRKSDLINDVTYEDGREVLLYLTEKYELCPLLNGISSAGVPCLVHDLGGCHGACMGKETAEDYNPRVELLLKDADLQGKMLLLTDKGRKSGEKFFVFLNNGVCSGYGYSEFYNQTEIVKRVRNRMTPTLPDKLADHLAKFFLLSGQYEERIELKD